MPEKSASQVEKELEQITHYKWEFLRRNPDYQKTYENYSYDEKKLQFKYKEPEFNKWQADQVEEFQEKWGINCPCNPKESNPKLLFDISHDMGPIRRQTRLKFTTPKGEEERYYPTWRDVPILDNGKEIRIPSTVVFGFNLDYPKGKIMSLFEKELDKLIKQRKGLLKKYKVKSSYRQAQINLYDEYLRIWDFVEANKSKTWPWKTEKLYPKKTVSVNKLFERYKACKELIDGGYLNIK